MVGLTIGWYLGTYLGQLSLTIYLGKRDSILQKIYFVDNRLLRGLGSVGTEFSDFDDCYWDASLLLQ